VIPDQFTGRLLDESEFAELERILVANIRKKPGRPVRSATVATDEGGRPDLTWAAVEGLRHWFHGRIVDLTFGGA